MERSLGELTVEIERMAKVRFCGMNRFCSLVVMNWL
jgi:hypothetical protein